jgi:two-component system OmpR family response regulator
MATCHRAGATTGWESDVRLLLVEDDAALADKFSRFLTAEGFANDVVSNGEDALHLGLTRDYAVAVLDIGLPALDGISILQAWRQNGRDLPVLILTARDGWLDKIAGFKAGADDYLAKPFHPEEALMRLRALVRRSGAHNSARIACGGLVYDSMTGGVERDGEPLRLTAFELRLLTALITRKGVAVSRDHLMSSIYGYQDEADPSSLEVIMGRLRRKISPYAIETIRGYGYRLTGTAA